MSLSNIKPNEVFKYFEEICAIPHGSENLEKISDYLVKFAQNHNLKYRQDDSLNVVIWKAASEGYENCETVILQGHMDMVAVKDNSCAKDMYNEGLDLIVNRDYIEAEGTSLGGDDGIAVAYALAILSSDSIKHPAIEAVFTVNEEIGMLGAVALDTSDLKGRVMLNIDSEEEGVFTAGCAGGAVVDCFIPLKKVEIVGNKVNVCITGLTGGHSGTEIICQRANSNILAGRILSKLKETIQYGIIDINGGEKDNAIASETSINMVIDETDLDEFENEINYILGEIKAEYSKTDPNITINYNISNCSESCESFSQSAIIKLIMMLTMMPYGVSKMSNDINGLVETSDNLGIVKTQQDDIRLCYSVRSSVSSEKEWLIDKMVDFTEFIGGICNVSGKYPAWEYKETSRLRNLMVREYKKLFEKEPVINTIHAGVECGIIADKIEGLDCISFGPDILDIHTTREKLSISSVERTWKLILGVLENINDI